MSMIIDVEIGEKERRVDIFNGEQRLVFVSDSASTKVFNNEGEQVLWVECYISFATDYPGITEIVNKYIAGINLGFDKRLLANQRHTYFQLLSEYIEIVEGRKLPTGISVGETEWVRLPLGGISGKLSTSDEQGNEITYVVHRKIRHREFVTHIVKKINQKSEGFNDRVQIEHGNAYYISTQIANPLKSIEDIEKFLCDHVREYKR